MNKIMRHLFQPNKVLGFFLFNVSMALLIYIFCCNLESTPLAYIAYFTSAYALILFCIWFYKACHFSHEFIKEHSKLYRTYHQHSITILKFSLFFSLILNFVYGIFKLISGIYYRSEWFITFAVYYLLLCLMKSDLALHVHRDGFGKNLNNEYKKLQHTGIILLFLDFVLMGMIILIIHQNQIITYPGYFIYLVAIYDFYLIISAFINVFRDRKQRSPVILSSKCINLTVAMISMISLEVAMIYQFGTNDGDLKVVITSWTGVFVCIVNSLMAIYMIVRARQFLTSKTR